jgi:hypothetical protein
MSRNLGASNCAQCGGPIVTEEPARAITATEAGPYFSEYSPWLLVSDAHCVYCHTRYLAWRSSRPNDVAFYDETDEVRDLSYRGSFNDEPTDSDIDVSRRDWVRLRQRRAAESLDRALRAGPPWCKS